MRLFECSRRKTVSSINLLQTKMFLGTATAATEIESETGRSIANLTAAEASNQCKDAIEHNESQNTEKNDEISIHLLWYMINPPKNSDPAQKPAKKNLKFIHNPHPNGLSD